MPCGRFFIKSDVCKQFLAIAIYSPSAVDRFIHLWCDYTIFMLKSKK